MADITISIPDDKVQRVRDAFAFMRGVDVSEIGLPEVKAYILNDLKQIVVNAEAQQFRQTFVEEDLGVS
jgi:hypothetical protein